MSSRRPKPQGAAARTGAFIGVHAGNAWMIGAPALLMAVLFFYPLIEVFKFSVLDPGPGLQNYRHVLSSGAVRQVAITTIRICSATTAITLILGYAFAYLLTHTSNVKRNILFVCVLIPMWISVLVRAFAWVMLLRREGTLNSLLMSSGIISTPLPLVWNEFGVIISMTHYMLPYAVLPLYTAMHNVDQRLIAAARGMGASRGQAFVKIFLPLTVPGIVGAGLLVFIFSLGFYVTPVIVGGGRVLMVAEYTSIQILEVLQWGIGTTLAAILILVICMLLGVIGKVSNIRELLGVRDAT